MAGKKAKNAKGKVKDKERHAPAPTDGAGRPAESSLVAKLGNKAYLKELETLELELIKL